MTTIVSLTDLPTLVGTNLGHTGYREITQEQVNTFAEAADDHQWIHTDPERAKGGPFGQTIAHGYLTLSLVIPFSEELLQVEGVTTKLNYGLERVRFLSPVPVGARIRQTTTIADVAEVKGGVQVTLENTIEVEGGEKPAVAAVALFRFYA